MNILEQEDIIKGLPDQALMKEASAPSGQVPQFLVVSEIKRRSDMRKRYQEQQQQPQGTVKDQIVMEAMGIGGVMPPQMAPQQPPMAPAGAPPMGGMPPMAPPMPQAGIASAPQGMPPMGMAQGGTVKMQTGGITSMPGSGALYGMQKQYIDPLLDRAQILARTAGISIEEAYQALVRQAQMNMPDYGMLGPAGMGELPSLEGVDRAVGDAIGSAYAQIPQYSSRDYLGEVGSAAGEIARQSQLNRPNYSMIAPAGMGEMPSIDVDLGMPTREQAQAADRAAVESIRSGLSPSITAGDIDSAVAGMVTERAPRSTIPELSTAPQRGAGGRPFDMRGISELFDFGLSEKFAERYPERVASNERTKQRIADFFTGESPEMAAFRSRRESRGLPSEAMAYETNLESDLMSGLMSVLDQKGTGSGTLADTTGIARKEGVEETPVSRAVTELSNYPSLDESNPFLDQVQGTLDAARKITGDISVQGKSKIQTQPTPASKAPSDVDMPALDFSDLIAESKQQALANAMIQLGAGVASGDVAKGLSAAGTAAMQGTSDARALDMKRRLAEYQAGREDIRRGDEADRFERQMRLQERKLEVSEEQFASTLDQADRKIRAEIDKGERVSMGQLMSFVSSLVKESMPDLAPEGKTMRDVVNSMTMELLQKYGPLMDVDVSGLGPAPTPTLTTSGKDLSQLNSLLGG